eukprot:gnl/TRDRNA2_/TRDRNA2_135625_c1_seq2.p1 gnl/TRDRNA2_/TRDRNA2_135625_c1~~gnl/TRDRNA2_/TRDRNA2_135625_c1_seq2.p1  ORF type:complete len:162 (+),score=28.81 gnl/TRDRNA2_/TRDRNA2_135625_c1_seq2:1-486(+)
MAPPKQGAQSREPVAAWRPPPVPAAAPQEQDGPAAAVAARPLWTSVAPQALQSATANMIPPRSAITSSPSSSAGVGEAAAAREVSLKRSASLPGTSMRGTEAVSAAAAVKPWDLPAKDFLEMWRKSRGPSPPVKAGDSGPVEATAGQAQGSMGLQITANFH